MTTVTRVELSILIVELIDAETTVARGESTHFGVTPDKEKRVADARANLEAALDNVFPVLLQ